MSCCVNCFKSIFLKNAVNTKPGAVGVCTFCTSDGTYLIDPQELYLYFEPILNLYHAASDGKFLNEQIIIDFPNIFAIDSANILIFLRAMLDGDVSPYAEIFSHPVKIDAFDDHRNFHSQKWDAFSEEIKTKNRFHLMHQLDSDEHDTILQIAERNTVAYEIGTSFYRARLSTDIQGYEIDKMGAPPTEKATPGRINPEGIPYLYLSNNVSTALSEKRAIKHDYITIVEFKISQLVRVVNLYEIIQLKDEIFELVTGDAEKDTDSLGKLLLDYRFMQKLSECLSKPNRRFDSHLEYLPTQYLSEFIKSKGYDGIRYKSSQGPVGFNLALFYSDKATPVSKRVVEIKDIEFTFEEIPIH